MAGPGQRDGPPGDHLAERMALAFAFNRRAALINGVLALLTVGALGPAVPLRHRLAWLALVAAALALRLLVGEARRRDAEADRHALRWGWRITLAMGLSGLAWGGGAALLVDGSDPVRQAFWVVALCGIGTGAVSGLRFFQPAIWAYLVPLLLPLALHLAASGAPVDRAIAGGLALFLVFSLIQGRSAARTLHESLAIRAENARLVAELTARHAEAQAARRLAEDAAADRARFFAAASHDLRQPMQALVLLDAALQQAPAAERPALQARLGEGVRTLDRLFEAILAVSTLQARPTGAAGPAPALPLADLAATLQARYGPQAESRGLRLLVRGGHRPLALQADAAALERLLGNLLANALRFTPAGGCVLLAWRGGHGGRPLRLQVRDNGCGIAPADQQRVFDAFVQVGNAHRDREAGTGLGLAIARRLAADLGGTLQLRSAPGRGSCFELRLPAGLVVPADPAADAASGPPMPAGAALPADDHLPAAGPVWIVDDDPLVRDALAALLRGWGIAALAVGHPDDLPADGAAPALLLCDRMLPGIDGLDAALALQQRLQPPPRVVMLSGLRDAAARATARARGWAWLDKPVRPMALRACLAAPGHGIVQADATAAPPPWPTSPPP